MKTWTIILAAATLLLASCAEDERPDKWGDGTIPGSAVGNYGVLYSVYDNGVLIGSNIRSSISISKHDDDKINFVFHSLYHGNIFIKKIPVTGEINDFKFTYSSYEQKDAWVVDEQRHYPPFIFIDGWLKVIKTRDSSAPYNSLGITLNMTLDDGTELTFEINGPH